MKTFTTLPILQDYFDLFKKYPFLFFSAVNFLYYRGHGLLLLLIYGR